MTDRELLELAAKGAGIKSYRFGDAVYPHSHVWTPLTDDGDALRLAVALRLDIRINGYDTWVYRSDNFIADTAAETHGDDPCAATRRAIVRAAAEIGRQHD